MNQELVRPYLIQRGRVNEPLAVESVILSNAVNLDYMGSAEFEFGALPSSLRAMSACHDDLKLRLVPHLTENDVPLRVLSSLSDEQFEQYVKYLEEFRKPGHRMHTKEPVRFEAKLSSQQSAAWDPNFWWDLNNNVMFSFKKAFMNRLMSYLTASFEHMQAMRSKA